MRPLGVPYETYTKIDELIESELAPAALHESLMNKVFYDAIKSYAGDQFRTGFLHSPMRHETEVLLKVAQLGTLERNTDLVATQVKDLANAMLSKYGIAATYSLRTENLIKYGTTHSSQQNCLVNNRMHIDGLEFHPIK